MRNACRRRVTDGILHHLEVRAAHLRERPRGLSVALRQRVERRHRLLAPVQAEQPVRRSTLAEETLRAQLALVVVLIHAAAAAAAAADGEGGGRRWRRHLGAVRFFGRAAGGEAGGAADGDGARRAAGDAAAPAGGRRRLHQPLRPASPASSGWRRRCCRRCRRGGGATATAAEPAAAPPACASPASPPPPEAASAADSGAPPPPPPPGAAVPPASEGVKSSAAADGRRGGRRRRREERRGERAVGAAKRARPAHGGRGDEAGGRLGQRGAELAERLVRAPHARVEREAAREVLDRAHPLLLLQADRAHQVEPGRAVQHVGLRRRVGDVRAEQRRLRLAELLALDLAQREQVPGSPTTTRLEDRRRAVGGARRVVARREQVAVALRVGLATSRSATKIADSCRWLESASCAQAKSEGSIARAVSTTAARAGRARRANRQRA